MNKACLVGYQHIKPFLLALVSYFLLSGCGLAVELKKEVSTPKSDLEDIAPPSPTCTEASMSFYESSGGIGPNPNATEQFGMQFISTFTGEINEIVLYIDSSSNDPNLTMDLYFGAEPGEGVKLPNPIETSISIASGLLQGAGDGPNGTHPIAIALTEPVSVTTGETYRVEITNTSAAGNMAWSGIQGAHSANNRMMYEGAYWTDGSFSSSFNGCSRSE